MFDFDLYPDTIAAFEVHEMNRHIADFVDGSASGHRHEVFVYFSRHDEAQQFEDLFVDYIYGAIVADPE